MEIYIYPIRIINCGGKKMKNKILCLFVLMLLIAIIPSTSTATEKQSDEKWTFLKGIIKINTIDNNTVNAFAYKLLYLRILPTERNWGWFLLKKVTFKDDFHIINLFGNIRFIIGIGRMDIPF